MSIHSTQVSQRISDLKYILLIKLIYYIYVFVNIASIDSKKLAPCRTKPKLSLLNEKMYIASLDVKIQEKSLLLREKFPIPKRNSTQWTDPQTCDLQRDVRQPLKTQMAERRLYFKLLRCVAIVADIFHC